MSENQSDPVDRPGWTSYPGRTYDKHYTFPTEIPGKLNAFWGVYPADTRYETGEYSVYWRGSKVLGAPSNELEVIQAWVERKESEGKPPAFDAGKAHFPD